MPPTRGANAGAPTRVRCAIYTRKSTEEGLEQDFNSLHAQREACEAFIQSQRQEGWRVLSEAYDDGGLSGATLERPALTRLLAAVRARRIDAVVVYKVDRLTRALTDFARIVELFDAHDVSFVSVTQQFNTTTSMGRLTLNVLLSFAQFEREVTAERIRDKIAASRKKGLWTGGPVPLGYDVRDKRLVIHPTEAETVRRLFQLYLEHGTVRALQTAALHRGLVTKLRRRKDGRVVGGRPFSRGNLYQLLANPIYIGRMTYKGASYPGRQDAIIDPETWEAVQEQLRGNASARRAPTNTSSYSLLTGLVFDDTGDRLRPTHANKHGRRYRYYVSGRLIDAANRRNTGWRLPAPMLEDTVIAALLRWLADPGRMLAVLDPRTASPHTVAGITDTAAKLAARLRHDDPAERGAALHTLVRRIEMQADSLRFELHRGTLVGRGDRQTDCPNDAVVLTEPIQVRRRGVEAKLVLRSATNTAAAPDPHLVALLARAHHWFDLLANGAAASLSEIAAREHVNRSDVSQSVRLTFLAPDITAAILTGRQPVDLTAKRLKRISPLPIAWSAQRRALGFGV